MTRLRTIAAMLLGGLWGMDAPAQTNTSTTPIPPAPEIMQHPDRPECAVYLNRFQMPSGDIEVWESPLGAVHFKFYRGDARQPDQVIVWELPEGTIVYPYTHTLEENDHGLFCIAMNREMG